MGITSAYSEKNDILNGANICNWITVVTGGLLPDGSEGFGFRHCRQCKKKKSPKNVASRRKTKRNSAT